MPKPDAEYDKKGWAATSGDLGQYPIAVHLLLGGEEKSDWALWPERDAIPYVLATNTAGKPLTKKAKKEEEE